MSEFTPVLPVGFGTAVERHEGRRPLGQPRTRGARPHLRYGVARPGERMTARAADDALAAPPAPTTCRQADPS